MRWITTTPDIPTTPQELVQCVLRNRGITDIPSFLDPVHPLELSLPAVGIDPQAVQRAVQRIREAKEQGESILVFGDYDCDGVCSSAVLWETLYEMGCKVMPFIPHREKHGYGLSQKALDEIYAAGKPDILISVDNGIVAHGQWQRIKDAGTYGILTDHHHPDSTIPPADCVIHTTKLCGTTVAWLLVRELDREKAASLLDLCAIGTIADQVPLTEANRSFAKHGLEQLNHTKRLGLQILLEKSGLSAGSIDAGSIHYAIAPRINAVGRLDHALDALRALCSRKQEAAETLVGMLMDMNVQRQDLTQHMIETAISRAAEWHDEHIIIVADETFHEGIIGLIASRLTETYGKPSIVFATGHQTSKASCRSVPGVHITNLLRMVQEDLLEVGGHPMAAGCKVATDKLAMVTAKLQQLARTTIDPTLLTPALEVECAIPAPLVTLQTADALAQLEPYGAGNREPYLMLQGVQVLQAFCVGKENKHLKLSVSAPNADATGVIHIIAFGLGERCSELVDQPIIDLVGAVQVNTWNNKRSVQMRMKDFRIV